MTSILILSLLVTTASVDDGVQPGQNKPWEDSVRYQMPDDPVAKARVTRAADWLKSHRVSVSLRDRKVSIPVIAWKDPTLEPANPKLLAGYIITDTLWSAKALKLFDPIASREMEAGIQRLGWYGNGLHDVLFHPIATIKHRPADQDPVHGFSLGRFPSSNDTIVDLRVFRQKWDAEFAVGHPSLFAEHAAYQALYDFWQGRRDQAAKRILEVVRDDRAKNPKDRIFWDDERAMLVDLVTYDDWLRFRMGEKRICRHFTFKLGVLLYAIRLLGMEPTIAGRLTDMKRRLWDAQTDSGGIAHFLDVHNDRGLTRGREPTGEATAIASLAEVVCPLPADPQR
jgi:hypothetical protein